MGVSRRLDLQFMRAALRLAGEAGAAGEVPVGAVLVDENEFLLASAANAPIRLADPTAHAEILVLREAGRRRDNYRLPGCTLYVTLEPCPMCASALIHARVDRLVFAVRDPKTGACGSIMDLTADSRLNHRIDVTEGPLAEEAGALLKTFFRDRR